MAKKIFPGNWVTTLSSYQGQPVVAVPGRQYFQKIGYALVDSTGGTEFAVTIPSPDMRAEGYCKINIELTSHDLGGVSISCIDLAKSIDSIR